MSEKETVHRSAASNIKKVGRKNRRHTGWKEAAGETRPQLFSWLAAASQDGLGGSSFSRQRDFLLSLAAGDGTGGVVA